MSIHDIHEAAMERMPGGPRDDRPEHSIIDDGGPAFPCSPIPGMSLRAYIATAALRGMLGTCVEEGAVGPVDANYTPKGQSVTVGQAFAQQSVAFADCLIAELQAVRP